MVWLPFGIFLEVRSGLEEERLTERLFYWVKLEKGAYIEIWTHKFEKRRINQIKDA